MNLNLQQLDLNLLLVFDALMRERNLSRAALRLHRSQPAVSNALARLRAQLGQPLFRRTAKGLEPTAAALSLHVPVRQALHGVGGATEQKVHLSSVAAPQTLATSG